MLYCPYCSEPVTKSQKICPFCKKSLDLDLLDNLYEPGESSSISKKELRRLWFIERSYIFWPVITLLLGLIAGGIIMFIFDQVQFSGERADLRTKIEELQATIDRKESKTTDLKSGLEQEVAGRDQIIAILDDQKETLTRIINFTRRFASAIPIPPSMEQESNSFKSNINYLIRQFETGQDKLKNTGYKNIKTYNLETVPQVLSNQN
ncbi:MAG: zinc ribbon domain-containing protein [Calditrichaceae bacterium]